MAKWSSACVPQRTWGDERTGTSMNANTQKLFIDGAAGRIEVLRDEASSDTPPLGCAVIAHPHPLHGGTMDNKVVQTLARAFVQAGYSAIRFNFRGVGASAGAYDSGVGEADDLLRVIDSLAPTGALALAGFSFGTYVALRALSTLQTDSRSVCNLTLIGAAAGRFNLPTLPPDLHPRTLVLHGEHDDTVALSSVMDWARPQTLPVTVVPGGSHFFHGQLPLLKDLVLRHLKATQPNPAA
jgi:uncharacterized protein